MTEPTTEAGRRLLGDHLHYDELPPDRMTYIREGILAIEQEAREQERRRLTPARLHGDDDQRDRGEDADDE